MQSLRPDGVKMKVYIERQIPDFWSTKFEYIEAELVAQTGYITSRSTGLEYKEYLVRTKDGLETVTKIYELYQPEEKPLNK